MNCSPPGSSVHGILQTKTLEWVAIPSPGHLPDPGIEPGSLVSPALAGEFFTTEPPGKPVLCFRAILSSKVTTKKRKKVKSVALNRL